MRVIFRHAAIAVTAPLAVTLLWLMVWEYYSRWRGQLLVDEIRAGLGASDPRWRLDEIDADRRPVDKEKNSALLVTAVHEQLPPGWHKEYWVKLKPIQPHARLSREQTDILKQILDPLSAPLDKARQLKDRPSGRYPLEYAPDFCSSRLIEQGEANEIADLLHLDALYSTFRRDPVPACDSHRALLNLGRSFGDEPLRVSMIYRMAIERRAVQTLEHILAHHELPAAFLAERQEVFNDELAVPFVHLGVRGERAGFECLYTNVEKGKIGWTLWLKNRDKYFKDDELKYTEHIDEFFAQSLVYESHATMLRLFTEQIEAARLPLDRRYQALARLDADIEAKLKQKDKRYELAAGILSKKFAEAEQHTHSLLACAAAAMSVERFRLENQRWPRTLGEAVKDVPLDRYDAQPLRYRHAADGVVIYSIGTRDRRPQPQVPYDGKALDDGAEFIPSLTRIEFRLWNPELRKYDADS